MNKNTNSAFCNVFRILQFDYAVVNFRDFHNQFLCARLDGLSTKQIRQTHSSMETLQNKRAEFQVHLASICWNLCFILQETALFHKVLIEILLQYW